MIEFLLGGLIGAFGMVIWIVWLEPLYIYLLNRFVDWMDER